MPKDNNRHSKTNQRHLLLSSRLSSGMALALAQVMKATVLVFLLGLLPIFAYGVLPIPRSLPQGKPAYTVHKVDIIGEDDRTEVVELFSEYPWKVGRLLTVFHNTGKLGSCSGSIIGNEYILTSAHCLIDQETGNLAKHITFDPGAFNGEIDFDNREVATEFWILSEEIARFIQQKKESRKRGIEDSGTDLALVRFPARKNKESVGSRQGVLNFSFLPNEFQYPSFIYTLGYPGDKKENTLWETVCEVDKIRSGIFPTDCDAIKGQSGSPVFEFGSFKEHGAPVIGVLSAVSSRLTVITPLTKEIVTQLSAIMRRPDQASPLFTKFKAERPTHGFHIKNECSQNINVAVAYRVGGDLHTEGWYTIEPGKEYELFRTDETSAFFMAQTRDGRHKWQGKHSIYISDKVNDYVPARLYEMGQNFRNHSIRLVCE